MTEEIKKNKYWEKYYDSLNSNMPPSQFAAFCCIELLHQNVAQLIEIASGEGRDSIFFAQQGIQTIALDRSLSAVTLINKKIPKNSNLRVKQIDVINEDLPQPINSNEVCAFYARFFIHTLDEGQLTKFFDNLASSMRKNDLFFTEYRNDNDADLEKVTPDHYRNFFNENYVKRIANQYGLNCEYEVSGRGYAKWNVDDAFVTRQIFIKL